MNVALLGFGTVGSGAYETIKKHCPGITVSKILARRIRPGYESIMTTDFNEILEDPSIDTVAEVLGGLHPSYEYVSAALKAGKNVVSANKHLICTYYKELTSLAAKNGVQLRYTPAVGGGIPWLFNLRRTKRCDVIRSFRGIVNGTTNFILDAMQEENRGYADVLAQAQELGYAEADPTADVDGLDARRKCAISASIAFDTILGEEDVPTLGIRQITKEDVENFKVMHMVCRLLASAENVDGKVAAYVEPTLLSVKEVEASIHEAFNCITLEAENVGTLRFIGAGAGKMPTGSSLVEDMIDINENMSIGAVREVSAAEKNETAADVTLHRYYIRSKAPILPSLVEKRCSGYVITRPISVSIAHALTADLRNIDPQTFTAGIKEA